MTNAKLGESPSGVKKNTIQRLSKGDDLNFLLQLRLILLSVQGCLHKVVMAINLLPVYSIMLRFLHSDSVAGSFIRGYFEFKVIMER